MEGTQDPSTGGNHHHHPYFPPSLPLPNYVPNPTPLPILLTLFASAALAVLGGTAYIATAAQRNNASPNNNKKGRIISSSDQLIAMWFALCGFIHFFFEGYFSLNNALIPSQTSIPAQLWKEYSLSDHRYLVRDSFLVIMESVTAFLWGPLSFLIAYLILVSSSSSSSSLTKWRHPLQMLVSSGQLYGDVLYMGMFFFDEGVMGKSFCRPEGYYFWVYFFGMNFIWIVIPALLVGQSMWVMAAAVGVEEEEEEEEKKRK